MGGQSPIDAGERIAARRTMSVSCALVILLTAYMVVKFLNGDFKDTEVWYDAGRRVRVAVRGTRDVSSFFDMTAPMRASASTTSCAV